MYVLVIASDTVLRLNSIEEFIIPSLLFSFTLLYSALVRKIKHSAYLYILAYCIFPVENKF